MPMQYAKGLTKRTIGFFFPILTLAISTRHNESPPYTKPSLSINASQRVDWEDWLSLFEYIHESQGSIQLPMYYEVERSRLPTHPNLAEHSVVKGSVWVSDIFGLSASKSDLSKYSSLMALAEKQCPELLNQDVDSLLSWTDLKLDGTRYGDHISVFAWDGRKYLMQGGGSHHFAAAHYRSVRHQVDRELQLPIHSTRLNSQAIAGLFEEFALLYSPDWQSTVQLTDALRASKMVYTITQSPNKGHDDCVIVLAQKDIRHRMAAYLLKKSFHSLEETLESLLSQQKALEKTPS